MYITNIEIRNYGAIKELKIEPKFHENGNPKPMIITGYNGSGKTLLLTNLVDAMFEIKKSQAKNYLSKRNSMVYKLGNKKYIRTGESEYQVKIDLREEEHAITYRDIVTRDMRKSMEKEEIKFLPQIDKFLKTGFYKTVEKETERIKKQVLIYFPTDRYYNPAWFNREGVKEEREDYESVGDQNVSGIIKRNLLEDVETWILDVLLDKYLYEQAIETKQYFVQNENGDFMPWRVKEVVEASGRNTTILNIINKLLTIIYRNKIEDIEYARIGVTGKKTRTVSVFIKREGLPESEVATDFSCLSSGEIMILSLFVSIIKEYDANHHARSFELEEIEGVVLIDEIDQNLHIKFCKEILPILIQSFPKIQFVLTTHSPFFLLGMGEQMQNDFYYLNMPDGTEIRNIEALEVIERCYNLLI